MKERLEELLTEKGINISYDKKQKILQRIESSLDALKIPAKDRR